MRRLILTHKSLVEVPDGLSHTEFVRDGRPDGLRLRDHGDVVEVNLEALLDHESDEVEAAIRTAFGESVRIEWYS